MPLTRIALRHGKPHAYKQAIMDQLYEAMRDTFEVPEDDRFMIVTEHDASSLTFGRHYLDIARSDDLIVIQLTVSDTRTTDQKKALFRRIVDRLQASPGVRPEDVFINLVEVARENWSFGHGAAQYA